MGFYLLLNRMKLDKMSNCLPEIAVYIHLNRITTLISISKPWVVINVR